MLKSFYYCCNFSFSSCCFFSCFFSFLNHRILYFSTVTLPIRSTVTAFMTPKSCNVYKNYCLNFMNLSNRLLC